MPCATPPWEDAIDAVAPLHHLVADELPAKGGAVPMMAVEDVVDLQFLVLAVLEALRQPGEDHRAFAVTGGDHRQGPGLIDKGAPHPRLETRLVGRQSLQVPWLEQGAVEGAEPLSGECVPVGVSLNAGGYEAEARQHGKVMGDCRGLDIQQLGQFVAGAFSRGDQADHLQPALVGQGLEEGEEGVSVGHGFNSMTSN